MSPPSIAGPRGAALLVLLLAAALGGASAHAQQQPPPEQPRQQQPSAPTQPATQPPPAPAFDPGTLPEVVARVNGADVTRTELIEEAKGAYAQLRQLGQAPPMDASFYRSALDQRIASMLLEAEAKTRGIAATPEEIEQRFAEARSRFESDEAFQRSLEAQGLTSETAKAELAQEISRYKYIETVIVPTIEVTDDAMRKFYDQNLEHMRQPERVKLRHLLIQVQAGATEDDRQKARQRAEELAKRAKNGEDFAALAREHSDDGTREQGGELPWIQRGQTLPPFEQAAFALQPGQVSDVVETPLGFHVIQAVDRQAPRVAEFDEVKDRIQLVLQSEEAQERLRQAVEGLMAKADVERFAL
jgi:peptidyl-prolyl cis-trans isomerase C